jgi:arylsulfatase A-like enzyme
VETPVELIDLYPTFLDLAGAAPQRGLEGSSLRPELEGGKVPARVAYTEIYPHTPPMNDRLQAVAARTAEWTYIWRPDGSEELYDRRRDPRERKDLAATRQDVLTGLRARTAAWRESLRRAAAALPPVVERALPADEADRLRKAGYLK